MYSCWYEGLQLYRKVASSQMLSCETFEVLQNIIFKENCWPFASDFQEHFGYITCFNSNKSTNCLRLPETAVNKRLVMFALEIFKHNQNIVNAANKMNGIQQKQSSPKRVSPKEFSEILGTFTGKYIWRSFFLQAVGLQLQ